jgi:hypothetical protein
MATTNTIFISAVDARQNPIRNRVVHDEGRAIESAILEAAALGMYSVTVSDNTPMTQSTSDTVVVNTFDNNTGTFYVPGHPFTTGEMVSISSTTNLPSPLNSTAYYFVVYVDADHIRLATTLQNAVNSRPVTIAITSGVSGIVVNDNGAGYESAPTVTLLGGGSTTPATAVAYLANYGDVSSIAVITPGSGYTDVPTVQISPQGAGATVGSVTFKVVAAVISTQGQNYRLNDVLSVVGGTGTSCTAKVTSVDNVGAVTSITVTNAGNYSALPTLANVATTSSPSGGTDCVLDLTMGLSTVTLSANGTGYVDIPNVVVAGGGGTNATAIAQIVAGTVASIIITNAGSGYTSAPSIDVLTGQSAYAVPVLQPTSVGNIILTNNGGNTYVIAPSVTISAAGTGATTGTVYTKVTSVVMSNGGSGYVVGDTLLVAGGAGSQNATIVVNCIGSIGDIVAFTLATSGLYTQMPVLDNNSVIGGSGHAASFNLSMGIDNIILTNGGSGYTSSPTVVVNSTTGYGAYVIAQMDGDAVLGLAVITSGTGYKTTPTITINGGSGATAITTLSPTSVDTISINTGGSGYTSATASITGNGTGATANVTVAGGAVTAVVVTNGGSGYTIPPTVTISGDGAGATASAYLVATTIATITLVSGGSGYTSPPTVYITGAGTARTSLTPTGVDRIDVTDGGNDYSSNPMIYIIPSSNQILSVVSPSMTVTRGFSIANIVVINPGNGYVSAPDVYISAPQSAVGAYASAAASIGATTGTMTIVSYPTSNDYFAAWKGYTISNDQYIRPYNDYMDTIIAYFTSLGYTINRITNPATNNTLAWNVKW